MKAGTREPPSGIARTACITVSATPVPRPGQNALEDVVDIRPGRRAVERGNGRVARSIDAQHPHIEGDVHMTVQLGVLALLESKDDKGDDLAAFLQAGRALAEAEAGTVTWYAFKISDTQYGIFDTFETEDARLAHLNGEIPTALGEVAPDLLAQAPDIRTVDIIAVK